MNFLGIKDGVTKKQQPNSGNQERESIEMEEEDVEQNEPIPSGSACEEAPQIENVARIQELNLFAEEILQVVRKYKTLAYDAAGGK